MRTGIAQGRGERATNINRRVFMFLMRQWHRDMCAYENNGHRTQTTEYRTEQPGTVSLSRAWTQLANWLMAIISYA